MTTIAECITCLSSTSNLVCKDNFKETRSYCCLTTDTDRMCQRDYCSPNATTTSMKLQSCPYIAKDCGGGISGLRYAFNGTS